MDRTNRSRHASSPETSVILVMGVTGSCKSHFINTLVAGSTRESASLFSETQRCQIVQSKISDDIMLAIVDTPGLDDTKRTDAEVLAEITSFLTTQYQLNIPLKGIIYLHRITDNRMQGTSRRNFEIFQNLCGEDALVEGLDRDQELRENWWAKMEEKESYIVRFDGSKEMAEALVAMLLGKEPVVLKIQRELVHQNMRLDHTDAAKVMLPSMPEDDKDRHKLERPIAHETENKIKQDKRRFGWKGELQVFAAVTGLAINVVFNLLPLFGLC